MNAIITKDTVIGGVTFKKGTIVLTIGDINPQITVNRKFYPLPLGSYERYVPAGTVVTKPDGTMYETIDWCAEFDFVNSVNDNLPSPPTESTVIGVPAPTDLWVTFREVPVVGNIRIGDVKEPIGFEHMTSSRYLDFKIGRAHV